MRTFRTLADALIGAAAALGAAGLIAVVVVILVDVVGRAFGAPLYGSQDITMMTASILVFGGMALCDRGGGHIAVDLFERYYPDWLNRAIDVTAALLGAVIFAVLAWAVWEVVALNARFGISSTTNLLNWPIDWFRVVLCALSVLTAFAMLLRAAELAFRGFDVRKVGA